MKMKKGLLSVAFLLATSSAMAAMSFSSADVKSDMNVSVKNSNEALLALIANGDHAAAGYSSKGELEVDLNKGYKGGWGVQNDSVYKWNKLFTVKNNSESKILVVVEAEREKRGKPKNLSEDVSITEVTDDSEQGTSVDALGNGGGKDDKNNKKPGTLTITDAKSSDPIQFILGPGDSKDINLIVDTEKADIGPKDFSLNVSAKRTDGK